MEVGIRKRVREAFAPLLLACFAFTVQVLLPAGWGHIPPFPGAEGFGAEALSGCSRRDVKVVQVTTLEGHGPGSLKHALETETRDGKLDIVVFRTGGTITTQPIHISRSCIYVAGRTAPGGGIQIRSVNGGQPIFISRHDIVLRYLRVRPGRDLEAASLDRQQDAIGITNGYNIVLDHLSLAWASDELIGINSKSADAQIRHITIQRSILAESLKTGLVVKDLSYMGAPSIGPISIHHNLFASNHHRNPRVSATKGVEVINNVVHNWGRRLGGSGRGSVSDWLNNFWLAVQDSRRRLLQYDPQSDEGGTGAPSIYIQGNLGAGFYSSDRDNGA